MTTGQAPLPRGPAAWETSIPTLADLPLDQVLKKGESPRDTEHPYTQIGIRLAPHGFRGICRDVARRHGVSFSQLTRLALKHGAALLADDPRMAKLTQASTALQSAALDSGEPSALARLDTTEAYSFHRSGECHTTLSCIWWVKGDLNEIADACHISLGRLAVVATLTSIRTLDEKRGYVKRVDEELDTFWEAIRQKCRVMGQQAANGAAKVKGK